MLSFEGQTSCSLVQPAASELKPRIFWRALARVWHYLQTPPVTCAAPRWM